MPRRKVPTEGYVEGAVLRVMLEDFLTYDSVEFRPGPHLNVIIGPNGTGKSTIVCALCLGLAGKPGQLGRATSLADYIKHGCSRAVIEIELVNKDGENYVIRREITKTGQSEWSVNGRKATLKAVEETVARLHIQVGNLCQFLPQDKVADFAKMSPTELLESTEQAVGPPDMYENHQRLKSARETARRYELDVSNTKKLLEQETQKNKRLEQDIKNFEERQQFMKKISYLKMKRPWIEYSEKRKEYQEQKEKKEKVQAELEKAKKEQAPLRDKLEATRKSVQQLDHQIKKKSEEIKQAAHDAANTINEISKGSEKAQEIYDHLQERQHQERERQRKVAELERHRESLQSEMAGLDDASQDVAPLLDKVNQDMRRVNQRMTQSQQHAENLQRDRGHLTREITGVQTHLQRLQDISNQRLNVVRQIHRDTYNAITWLRSNTHRFQGVIHEPIMTVINMKDPRYARYVESQIPFNDMRAFVCESEDDNKLFLRHMRDEQKLKVNTVQAPQERLDSFKPKEPLAKYKQYGFACYMKDVMECPDAVMSYLCLMHKIHQIPIGTSRTKERVEQITKNCPELTNFYTENHRYTIRKSRYNPNITSSRCTELKKARLLTVTQDHQQEKALREELQTKQAGLTRLEEEYRNCQTSSRQMESEMNKLRQEKQNLMHKRDQRRSIQQKIAVKTQNIERLQGEYVDMAAEKAKYAQRIQENNNKISNLLRKFSGHVQQCATLGRGKVRLGMQHTSCLRGVQDIETELREGSHTLQNLEREFEGLKERTKMLLANAKRLLEEARRITGIQSDADLPDEMTRNFYNCPNSLEEIDALIHEIQARADCTMATDENVVNDYKRRKTEISRLNADLDKKSGQLAQHQEDIEKIKTRWIDPIKDLIARINENFSFYFSSMKCAGEVDLSVPENPEDYEKYALRIKVKFRDTETLRELNPFHQSGGERSVATVLYMMALQELTKCPFRCVDEINQGMDPQNERKVFELVCKTVCQRNSSQYFLLTPKLLPDLSYSESMTILCIYNGPHMIDHRQWDLQKFREIRQGFE